MSKSGECVHPFFRQSLLAIPIFMPYPLIGKTKWGTDSIRRGASNKRHKPRNLDLRVGVVEVTQGWTEPPGGPETCGSSTIRGSVCSFGVSTLPWTGAVEAEVCIGMGGSGGCNALPVVKTSGPAVQGMYLMTSTFLLGGSSRHLQTLWTIPYVTTIC